MAKPTQPSLGFLDAPTVVRRGGSRRRKCRVDATGGASSAIGKIEPGCEIFGFTKGQFSLTDVILHILAATGPADVVISTWTAAKADMLTHHRLLTDGRLLSLRWIVDASFPGRRPEFCKLLADKFGAESIRLTRTHAKFVTIRNDKWAIVLRTSMNLNNNQRFENFEISDGVEFADFFGAIVDEVFDRQECGVSLSFREINEAFQRAFGGGEMPKQDRPQRRDRLALAGGRA